jgi:hypothetical protein
MVIASFAIMILTSVNFSTCAVNPEPAAIDQTSEVSKALCPAILDAISS